MMIIFLVGVMASVEIIVGWALIAYLYIDAKRSHYESSL